MKGKSKCKILKDIRRQIAQDNDIEFVTSECKYQGDCTGTCPKCEAEVRYLEQELEKRRAAGKAVAVAGIAAALVIGAVGCGMDNNGSPSRSDSDGDTEPSASTSQTDPTQTDPTELEDPGEVYSGDITLDYTEPPELAGVPLPPDYYYMTPGAIVAP